MLYLQIFKIKTVFEWGANHAAKSHNFIKDILQNAILKTM